ncbi:MAG: T9SS type A sorting domain-containing protein [Agriterribacter sp.]
MKIFYLSFLYLLSTAAISQTKLSFSYDAAGNQVLRNIGAANRKMAVNPAVDTIPGERFIAFPNPVTNKLFIQWAFDESPLQAITLHTLDGRLLYKQSIISASGQTELPFSGYASGIYILTGIRADGKTDVIKIIRK